MSDLSKWESNLPITFVGCRDFHHAWKPLTASKTKTGFERTLECVRCRVRKVQELDNFGYLNDTRFIYVEGYRRPSGSGRITAADNARMRLRGLKRDA